MGSETAAGFEEPLLGGAIVQAGEVGLHVVGADCHTLLGADGHDPGQGPAGVLQGLPEQRLGEV